MSRFAFKPLIKRFGEILTEYEKILLALLSVAIVVSGGVWYRQFSRNTSDQPTAGGTFVDGVVGDKTKAEELAARVTKAGLFTINANGDLQNQLVSTWTVNADKTQYRFTLLPDVPVDEIRNDLQAESDILGPAVVSEDGGDLVITLESADPSLPIVLTQPLFNFGPYKISKISDKTTVLTRNTRPHAVSTYINKIIIQTYSDEAALESAIAHHKVDGALVTKSDFHQEDYQTINFGLPHYYTVFFNINKSPFRDQSFRQNVIAAQSIPTTPFTLIAPDAEPYKSMAQKLVATWQAAGAKATLELHNEAEIQSSIAPSRSFQALLSGVDYGFDLDPYYLWDSSQLRPPGNNLTGIKSDKIDAAITQVQATTNIKQRRVLIDGIHQLLKDEAVAIVVEQETATFAVSTNVRTLPPWVPTSPQDYLQAIASWSVK